VAPGEYDPGLVPLKGWGYSSLNGIGDSSEYILDGMLSAGQFITITLAWDRRIESTGGNTYSSGDTFFNSGIANFDVRLVKLDGTVVAQSNSADMNLDHIFFPLQADGQYKIEVRNSPGDIGNPHARLDERDVETEPGEGPEGTGNRKGRQPTKPTPKPPRHVSTPPTTPACHLRKNKALLKCCPVIFE